MRFQVGCRLSYALSAPGTLVFNVHAINCANQRVLQERFDAPAKVSCDEWADPVTRNRFVRINAPAGLLEIGYSATVETAPVISAPEQIGEIAASRLPLDVFPFLYPSRYCQSDRLERLAFAEWWPRLRNDTCSFEE